ncbi:hypothetical protein BCD48_04360 [Pseudofrankia sp. BMG5.36]|nr:hypothetical protein BCD48_04360 [Pseudofrankia sp. BMG5.36]
MSESWFYKWRHGDESARRARRRALAAAVRWLFHLHRGLYGSPRITAELRARGWSVSKNTVAALMAELGLAARRRRRRRGLTKADRNAAKPPDLVRRRFCPPEAPDRVWVGDLTEIPNSEGRLYLASVLDLHSRRIVGFALGPRHNPALATAALRAAIAARGGHVDGVVLHTDQGGEYTATDFADTCQKSGVTQSMGRTGSALDNAVIESWHSTLEFELLARAQFTTRAQAKTAVADYIDWYNTKRRHSTCGGLSPAAYEHQTRPGQNHPGGHPEKDKNMEAAGAATHPQTQVPVRERRAPYEAAPPGSRTAPRPPDGGGPTGHPGPRSLYGLAASTNRARLGTWPIRRATPGTPTYRHQAKTRPYPSRSSPRFEGKLGTAPGRQVHGRDAARLWAVLSGQVGRGWSWCLLVVSRPPGG